VSHERQKPVNDKYRDNYDRIFARKGKQAKPTQAHRDRTKYRRPDAAAYKAFKEGDL
jgi:hypothetical protein